MRVLIAPDSFKGTLRAHEAADAIMQGIRKSFPDAHCISMPLADGGEGTMDAVRPYLHGEEHVDRVRSLTGVNVVAPWLDFETGALIESASVLGHGMVREPFRKPLHYHSGGLGDLISHAHASGDGGVYVALGGSGSHDCGMGTAYALGYRFYNEHGEQVLPSYDGSIIQTLGAVRRITVPATVPKCIAIADVQNPLTGPEGAAMTYARQKGFPDEQLAALDDATASFADAVMADVGDVRPDDPGMGAAGGLGFGLAAFCNAEIVPGIDWVMEHTGFIDASSKADIIVTGEGRYDAQTRYGKVVNRVAAIGRRIGKDVLVVAGSITDEVSEQGDGVSVIQSSQDGREPGDKQQAFAEVVHAVDVWFKTYRNGA